MNKWLTAISRWFFRRLPFSWQLRWTQRHGNRITSPVRMSDPRSQRISPLEELIRESNRTDTTLQRLQREAEQRRLAALLQNEA